MTTSDQTLEDIVECWQQHGGTLGARGSGINAGLDQFEQASLGKLNPKVRKDWMQVVLNTGLGIGGEAGEVIDTIKKLAFHDKDYDVATLAHLIEEMGDLMFYVAVLAVALNVPLDTILVANMAKLNVRYDGAFNLAQFNDKATTDKAVHAMMERIAAVRFIPNEYDDNNSWEL